MMFCCLHSLFQLEVSENKSNFFLSKFKISPSLPTSGSRSVGLWLRPSALRDWIASHRLALAAFRMTFSPIQCPSLVLVIDCPRGPSFWLGKAESSQPICQALIIAMLWVHGTTGALLKFCPMSHSGSSKTFQNSVTIVLYWKVTFCLPSNNSSASCYHLCSHPWIWLFPASSEGSAGGWVKWGMGIMKSTGWGEHWVS